MLVRLISSVRERVAKRLWLLLSKLPNIEQTTQLEALLFVNEKTRQTLLDKLRRSPTRTSSSALVNALNRNVTIRSLGIRQLPVAKIPPTRLKALSRNALTVRVQAICASQQRFAIARMPSSRRLATLVAFAYVMEAIAPLFSITKV